MSNQLTIKIPFDLARFAVWQRKRVTRYETNQVIKALDTWLTLKALTRASLIQSWNKQKAELLTVCKCSESIFRHRLKLLQGLNLVTYDRNNIQLCSWEKLGNELEIDIQSKFTIQFPIDGKQRVQDWLIATEIKENQNRQSFKIMQKLNKNPAAYKAISNAIIAEGGDAKRLNDFNYFHGWMLVLYRGSFVTASAIHNLFSDLRPDNNRGVNTMAAHWKVKSSRTVSYWKKILQSTGIIDISKLQVQSQARVRNSECKVLWLKESKQTLLCLCDSITVMQPWLILQSFLTDNADNTNAAKIMLSA